MKSVNQSTWISIASPETLNNMKYAPKGKKNKRIKN